MQKLIIIFFSFCVIINICAADERKKISLPLSTGLSQADLYYLKPTGRERAVLLLCPGHNGNGSFFLKNANWVNFAKQNKLGIVGLSFRSKGNSPRTESYYYYYAKNGAGQVLLDGLKQIYYKDIPILLYGFSGGAHFVARLAEWNPERILGWCAYSAAWWDKPAISKSTPPGIIVCGKLDERMDASLRYFWDGRELRKPWLWIELPDEGHSPSMAAEAFFRDYFEVVLSYSFGHGTQKGSWVNIYTHNVTTSEEAQRFPCATAWLPDGRLYEKWKLLMKGLSK